MTFQKTILGLSLGCVLTLYGCAKPTSDQAETEVSTSEITSDSNETAKASSDFDLNNIPISTAVLGEFPYIELPQGYRYQNDENRKFERVPFWTGHDFHWVEGKLFSSGITAKSDYKKGSYLEIQRNLDAVIKQLGGVEVANSQIPKELANSLPDAIRVQHGSGLADIYNYPAQTYVIRQADKNIWFHLAQSGHYMGLMVAESQPLNITAKALTSSALKQSLDQNSKVSVQINFATDQADILPDSQEQIDQIIALLKDNDDLKLGIYGHTDNTGDAAHNLKLSEQRAQAVVTALTKAGIDTNRLTAKGFGDTQPVADNATEDGKAKNRRVELVKL
ncbi:MULTISPECIES: OmpA family protein [Acinetobacter]|uniref:OmpA family protein n=1 Tax=Acinetobacter TaxID=469 RepID=UPI0015D18357|nr:MULTISPECIES: OmpA family protein [Acinetobacter]MDM1276474.1 OmpA family protein [Acinetobacter indicus]MDM1302540.1 OmpA family protein [Acinetobacter indicus]